MSLAEAELDSFLTEARSHLELMGSLLDSSGVWVRSCDHRDIVAGAHISRMAQTCESLLVLCGLRRAHDASALSRVLLEHAISLTFLFSQPDSVKACHGFVFDSLTYIGEAHQQAAKHYPEQVILDSARSEKALRLGEGADYQGKFKRQLCELRKLYPDAHFDWFNDLVYGDLSIRTHPHAAGMMLSLQISAVFSLCNVRRCCMKLHRLQFLGGLSPCRLSLGCHSSGVCLYLKESTRQADC